MYYCYSIYIGRGNRWDIKYPKPTTGHVTNGLFERWAQVPFTIVNVSHDAIEINKHTVMGTLWLYVDYQGLQK